jgi:hypothetical protein
MSQQAFFNFESTAVHNTRGVAAASIAPLAGGMLRQVLELVDRRGECGATDEEIASALRMLESTARARRVELRDGGQVRDCGLRRKTRSGRPAIVWMATGKRLE